MSTESDQIERVNKVVQRFYKARPVGFPPSLLPAFDTSKQNFHDSKPEFLAEKQAVGQALDHASNLCDFLFHAMDKEESSHKLAKTVCSLINRRTKAKHKNSRVRYASDLVRKNASDIGVTRGFCGCHP